ncbi:MAG TPA: GNAT family N-acetyltransferase [Ktedonobacterales bacterium]|jgi:ribosomal protein S18 acetylase RimI-like enzyme
MPSDLERIQAYLRRQARRGRIAQALAAFTVYTATADDAADLPYAIPRRLTRTLGDADLDELHAIFRRRNARPRVEFLAGLYPDLPERLASVGYQGTRRQSVLLARQRDIQSPPLPAHTEVIAISQASSLEEVCENLDTNALGFDEPAGATEGLAEAFRAGLLTSRAFTLRLHGCPVAAGMFEAIMGGVTELMGIATLREYRQRGFAAYLTAAMAESAFAHGASLVFLCAVSEEAGRVYQRASFRPYAALVEYTRG